MKEVIFLMQFILLFIQGFVYFFSGLGEISFLIVNISAITVIISFLLSLSFRNKTNIKGKNFSIILFFVLMSWIISFQVPLEIVYGNDALLDPALKLIYDENIVNGLVAFSSLMLNVLLLGVTYSYTKYSSFISLSEIENNPYNIPNHPLIFLILICFVLFFMTVNKDYVDGGHGSVALDSISASSIGFLAKFSVIYLSIKLFNFRHNNLSIVKYIYSLNVYYVSFLFLALMFFFMANNRVYPIMIFTPLIFSMLIYYKKKIKIVTVLSTFLMLSIFGTLFRIYGFSDFYKSGFYIDDGYIISKFFFPFTAELAGSIYSNTILYSMWNNSDFSLYGASYLVGIMRAFPGIMGYLNVSPILYDSAVIATLYSNTSYGVGTTAIIDILVNFGVYISLFLFLVLGYFFGKSEMKVYANNASIYSYIIYLTITILIFFYPRSSLNDLIGMLLFNIIFFKFYVSIFGRSKK